MRWHNHLHIHLGDRVVDIDGRDLECAGLEALVEIVHSGGGLLGETDDIWQEMNKKKKKKKKKKTRWCYDEQTSTDVGTKWSFFIDLIY